MGKIFVLGDDAIEDLLHRALVGRIACCDHGEAVRPFLVPLAYGYDGDAVYAVSTPGRKITIMRQQPLVTFEVDEAEAEDRWSSVIAEAVYEELSGEAEIRHALAVLARRGQYPELTDHSIVYRLRITAKSGRFEVPDSEAHRYM